MSSKKDSILLNLAEMTWNNPRDINEKTIVKNLRALADAIETHAVGLYSSCIVADVAVGELPKAELWLQFSERRLDTPAGDTKNGRN
jgi:hypothetical protein